MRFAPRSHHLLAGMQSGCRIAFLGLLVAGLLASDRAAAQPTLVDRGLEVQSLAPPGLSFPTAIRFLGQDDFLAIEKNSGKVKRVHGGAVDEVLDLRVATNSERGLLGIELHPDFDTNGYVYLYYSAGSGTTDGGAWTDNRLERFVWNGTSLTSDATFPTFSIASDAAQPNGPNHDGGPLRFGPDGKLYLATGDLNRNRIEQNNTVATASALTGGIYRLNDDGTLPADNPFVAHPNADLRELFAYGVRNSFGMSFDPVTGRLWDTENGPTRMDEINVVDAGFNSGWTILMGPEGRDPEGQGVENLVDLLPQSTYSEPEFSFSNPIGITVLAFLAGSALGPDYDDGALVGDVNTGSLYLFRLNGARDGFVLSGDLADLADLVADNATERNLLRFGSGFGFTTDLQVGPDGALYALSVEPVPPFFTGRIYRIALVPEPGTGALLALGLLALARRRRRVASPPLVRARGAGRVSCA